MLTIVTILGIIAGVALFLLGPMMVYVELKYSYLKDLK